MHENNSTQIYLNYNDKSFYTTSGFLMNLENAEYVRFTEGNYFINADIACQMIFNKYYSTKRSELREYSDEEAKQIIVNELIEGFENENELSFYLKGYGSNDGRKSINLKISGFFFDREYNLGYIDSCDELTCFDTTDVTYMIFSKKNGFDDIIKLFLPNTILSETYKKVTQRDYDGNGYISLNSNYIIESMCRIKRQYSSFEYIFAGIAAVVLVISLILMFKYINDNIDFVKNDIGIIKSLGASSRDIIRVFNTQNIFSIVICLLGVLILYPIGIFIVNKLIAIKIHYQLDLFFVGVKGIIVLIIVGVMVPIISTIFPIIRISKKNITDLLKEKN